MFAAATFAALNALAILSAQTPEPLTSQIQQKTPGSNFEQRKEAEQNNMSGLYDFDLLIESWRVHHRRLKERLAHNNEWEEFAGACRAQKILGGQGNMDDNVIELPAGAYRAVSTRTYNPATKLWLIWWVDSRDSARLDPPVVGSFKNAVGTFYAQANVQRQADSDTLRVDQSVHHAPLGAGILRRWRQNMGNQLDDGFHQDQ